MIIRKLAGGDKPHVSASDIGCSSGVGSIGHSVCVYCMVAARTSFQVTTTCSASCIWSDRT